MGKLTFIDMFAGIGGFRSGMEQAGHKCVGWIEWDKFARQSYQAMYDTEGEYNAKNIQTVSGTDLPDADVWCFGSPCQSVSLAGKRAGLKEGTRSGLFLEVIRLLKERIKNKKALPKYLFMENVKGLLSSTSGRDFARVQIEMDEAGYDVEWNVFNSAEVVPQNRERVYIVGHLRGASTRKVFPIIRESSALSQEQSNRVKNIGLIKGKGSYRTRNAVYSIKGVSPTLTTMQGGGQEPKILVRNGTSRGYSEATEGDGVGLHYPNSKTRRGRVQHNRSNTLTTDDGLGVVVKLVDQVKTLAQVKRPSTKVSAKVLANGSIRVYQEDCKKSGIQELQVTGPRCQSMAITCNHAPKVYDLSSLRIRKLTPLECWRLQGFEDEQFYKAKESGVSNSQLYKQSGNAVTVPVVKVIAERLEIK